MIAVVIVIEVEVIDVHRLLHNVIVRKTIVSLSTAPGETVSVFVVRLL